MSEIDLLAEVDPPCPRGCGRSFDECHEAEDGEDCFGSPLVRDLEAGMAKRQRQIEVRDAAISALGTANLALINAAEEAIGNTAAIIELPEIKGTLAQRLIETVSQLRGDWVQRGYRIGELKAEVDRLTDERAAMENAWTAAKKVADGLREELASRDELDADYRKVIDEMQQRLERADERKAKASEEAWQLTQRVIAQGAVVEAAKAWRNDGDYSSATRVALVAAVDALPPAEAEPDGRGEKCGCYDAENDPHTKAEHTYCGHSADPPCGGCNSCLSAQIAYARMVTAGTASGAGQAGEEVERG